MIRNKFIRSFAIVLIAIAALSCAESSPTGPAVPVQSEDALLTGLTGRIPLLPPDIVRFVGDAAGLTIHPVPWSSSRAKVSYKVSGTITRWGGTILLPEADFSLSFPAGAVETPTVITITSDENYVAYKMEPQGIRFARPVVATQRLKNTAVFGSPLSGQLFGAYISDDLLDLSTLLHALEIETSMTIFSPGPDSSPLPDTEVWLINHFSRYMLASG